MLTDTHAHLDYEEFAGDFDEVLMRSRESGVERIITIGTSLESSRRAIELAEAHPMIHAVVGIHPTSTDPVPRDLKAQLKELAGHRKVIAIGETGLDYHRLPSSAKRTSMDKVAGAMQADVATDTHLKIADGAEKARQAELFGIQLDLAVELGLNVVIHQRSAWSDTIDQLAPFDRRISGVFHCFGGSPQQAAELAAKGHLVSFTGIVTFKNAGIVRDTVKAVSGDGYMVETDCPYLAPVPHRGKRCEPAHTRLIAEKIAEIRGISLEEVGHATEATAERFFRFSRS